MGQLKNFSLLSLMTIIFLTGCNKDGVVGSTQIEDNKTVAKRVTTEVVLQNNLNVDQIISSDFVYHQAATGTILQRKATLDFWQGIKAAFPDIKLTFRDVVAQGDLVGIRYTSKATHTGGSFFGIPAAGKSIEGSGLIIRRIKDGKVAEEWDYADVGSLVQQLTGSPTISLSDYTALSTSNSSIDDNITLAKRVSNEVVLRKNLNVDEIIASNFKYHVGGTGTILDKPSVLPFWQSIVTTFPDIKLTFEQQFGEGNLVVLRYSNKGTGATGSSFLGVPAAGKTISIGGIIMRRIENGKVAEEWDFTDVSTMLNQLK